MGYYIWRYGTIFRGPRATSLKERWEIRRLESEAAHLTHEVFNQFPEEVKKRHTITHFFERTIPRFIGNFKKLCENCFKIEANQLSQDISELKEEEGVIAQLHDFWGKVPKDQIGGQMISIERKSLLTLAQEDKKDELLNREEYNEVEAIINEAKKFDDHQKFMIWLRTRIKKRQQLRNVLEGFSWRSSVRASTRELLATKDLRAQLRRLLERISKEINQSNFKRLSGELQEELNLICSKIRNYFKESYLVRERAILTILKAFYTLEYADTFLQESIKQHELPSQQTQEARNKLNEVIEEVGKKFHNIVAQEFRIVIHDLEKEEREAERLARAA